MPLEKFTLETLGVMDGGRLGAAFRHAMQRAEDDCRDRPAVKDARKVIVEITLQPIPNPEGDLESVDTRIQIVDRVPKRKSKVYNMRSSGRGLLFNELSPDDVRQGTLELGLEAKPKMDTGDVEEADEESELDSDVG